MKLIKSEFYGSKLLSLCLVMIAFFAHTPALLAQSSTASDSTRWANIRAVAIGNELNVKSKDGKTVKGRLGGVTDNSLTLIHGNKKIEFTQDNVLEVNLLKPKHAGRNALLGAGAGFGAGAAMGALASQNT